jgi:hypothetical protein
MLHVNGNQILDANNQEYQIKAVSLTDISELKENYRDKIDLAKHFWNINTIRVPVYPPVVPGRRSTYPYLPGNYLIENVVSPIIDYANAHNLNVILDWHDIGALTNESVDKALEFWKEALPKLAQFDNIIVEVFNEPTNANTTPAWEASAVESWALCKPFLNTMVSEVRSLTEALIICPTPVYCRLPQGADNDPLSVSNVAYSVHAYPPEVWEREGHSAFMQGHIDFNNAVIDQIQNTTNVPLVLTEVGLNPEYQEFTNRFSALLTAKPKLSWVAWCLSIDWWPPLLTEYNTPNKYGKIVRNLMA